MVAIAVYVVINLLCNPSFSSSTRVLDATTVRERPEESRKQGSWSFWIARNYLLSSPSPPVVLFGSSLIGSATFSADAATAKHWRDCVVDRRAITLENALRKTTGHKTEVFNASLPGSMASDAYMISKALFKADNKPRLVIIGVNPRDFIDNNLSAPADTDPFHFFAPYVALDQLSKKAFSDPFGWLDWAINENVALKRVRAKCLELAASLQRQVPAANPVCTTIAQRDHAAKKGPMQAILFASGEVKVGEWLIPYPMPFGFINNMREYQQRYKNPFPPLYSAEKSFFTSFLAYLHSLNVDVLVVSMPSTAPNRSLLPPQFWQDYRNYLSSRCTEYGAQLLDLSDDQRFGQYDYLDTVHLNGNGGFKLFSIIAEKVAQSPRLAAAIAPMKQPAELRDEVQTTSVENSWH